MSAPLSPAAALAIVIDVMRRSDPDYVQAHGVEHCSDDEWDRAIEIGEDALDACQPAAEAA